jgi:hypothetical protein
MGSFQKDINYQASVASLVVAGIPSINQVPYNTTIDTAGGVYVGNNGNLDVIMAADNTNTVVTYSNVPAGIFLPIQVKKVMSTSTCSGIFVFMQANKFYQPDLLWEQALFNWENATINWNY